jgi:predicted Rdx family selenoprotein
VKAWFEARGRGPVEAHVGSTGQFDIVAGGKLVYSKRDTGRFPTEADLEKLPV